MIKHDFDNGTIYNGNCLELMANIPNGSVDMILCDLPYGTTQNEFDKEIIPFEPLWEQYWRVSKPNAAIVLTSAQPFTSALVQSQLKYFKYEWIWHKSKVTGFLNAKKQPLRSHESVLVFYKSQPTYNPQGVRHIQKVCGVQKSKTTGKSTSNYGQLSGQPGDTYIQTQTGYPTSVIDIGSETSAVHPTQKPVELFEYLIKTYTDKGDTVLDNTSGSGTTAVAAENTGRKWICMEMDEKYYTPSVQRIQNTIDQNKITIHNSGLFDFGDC